MPPTREEALAQLPTGITLQMSATEKPKGPPRSVGRTWKPSTAPPGWRALTASQIGDLRIKKEYVRQEQGVENWERWFLKWFGSHNPEGGKAFLRDNGYYVVDYGPVDSFNYAVQKIRYDENGESLPADPENWRVVDPSGLEIFKDLIDITGDIIHGAVTGAATTAGATAGSALGPAGTFGGGVGGAAVGASATETIMEGIGEMAGIPDNLDYSQVAMTGALAGAGQALIPGAAKLIGKGVRKVAGAGYRTGKEVAEELGSRIAVSGQSAGSSLTNQAALKIRARTMPYILPSLEDAKSITLKLVERLRRSKQAMKEQVTASGILALNKSKRVDIGPALQKLKSLDGSLDAMIYDSSSVKSAKLAIERIFSKVKKRVGPPGMMMGEPGYLGVGKASEGVTLATPTAGYIFGRTVLVPATMANSIKQSIQKLGRFDKNTASNEFTNVVRRAQWDIRDSLHRVLGDRFHNANEATSAKLEILDWVDRHVGKEGGESFVNSIFGESKGEARKNILELDRLFGSQIKQLWSDVALGTPAEELIARGLSPATVYDLAVLAKVGTKFSREGAPTIPGNVARFTAGGKILGPSMVAGGFGGSYVAGPVGGLVGALLPPAAALAASPRSIVGMTSAAQRLGPQMRAAGSAIGRAATDPKTLSASRTAMQAALRDYAQTQELFPTARKTHKPVVRLR